MTARIGLAALFLAMVVVSLKCAATQKEFEAQHWDESVNGPIPAYPATIVDSLRVETLPDSGVYYVYRAPDANARIGNIENRLRRLYVLGIDVTAAWYRPSRGGCDKPASDAITTTTYPEFLLLHLDGRNDRLLRYNFYEIARPVRVPCPYWISVYTPQRRS